MNPTATRAVTDEPVSGRSVLAFLGLWIASTAVLGGAGFFAATSRTNDAEAPTLAAVFLAYLALPLAALAVYQPRGLRDRLAVRAIGRRGIGLGALAFLVTATAGTAAYLLVGLAAGSATGPGLAVVRDATDLARFGTATPLDWALIVPRALILAGIAEELLFRGILYGWLRQHLAAGPTILITAGLFALEHGYYPVLLPVGLLFGLVAGWLRHRTGSILPGLVAHMLTDTLLFGLALLTLKM